VVWVRGAAIRPVPPHAVVPRDRLEAIESELAREASDDTREGLDAAFRRFEETQPALSEMVAETLARPIDETALALGYFLSIAVWMAFERSFGARLTVVTDDALAATHAALKLEEELRADHAEEPLDLDDVVAMEQPGVMAFVHEHVEAALDPAAGDRDVDVDDVHHVYRTILALVLALSHAVRADDATNGPTTELLA
jgi:hypothetical protein